MIEMPSRCLLHIGLPASSEIAQVPLLQLLKCSGQLIPDTTLSLFSD
jgi:hypothetical protein